MLSFKQRISAIAAKKSKKTQQEGIQLSPSDFIVDLNAMDADSIFAKSIANNDDEATLNLKMKKQRVAN